MADPAKSQRESAKADDICLHEALANLKANPSYYARSRLSQLIHFPLTSFDFVTGNRLTLGAALPQKQYRVLAMKGFLYAVFSLAPSSTKQMSASFARSRMIGPQKGEPISSSGLHT